MMLFLLSKSGSCNIRYFGSLHTLPRLAHRETMFVNVNGINKICNTHSYISTPYPFDTLLAEDTAPFHTALRPSSHLYPPRPHTITTDLHP